MYTICVMNKNTQFIDFFLQHPYKVYEKGEIVLDYNAYSPQVFYITSGYIRAYSISPSGRQKIYVFYQPQEIFPIIWIFNNMNKQLFYEAMDTVVVHSVPKDEFLDFIKDKPEVLREVIHRIVDRHSLYVDRVDNLCQPNGRKRIVKTLLTFVKRFGRQYLDGILIPLPVTHSDMAGCTAMTRESASRELEYLQKKGLIGRFNNLFFIPNVQKLEEELRYPRRELKPVQNTPLTNEAYSIN